MSLRPLILIILSTFALSACQQAAWKAGASSDDLKRDEQTCRAQVSAADDDAALKQCLRDKGWTVTDFSAPTADADIAPAAETPVQLRSTPAKPATGAATTTETSSGPRAAETGQAAPAPAPKHIVRDPLQRQSIQSWWKAGAQAADFDKDASACLEQLGSQHTPDYTRHLYTRAMASCLRERGWFAGRDPVYTPLR